MDLVALGVLHLVVEAALLAVGAQVHCLVGSPLVHDDFSPGRWVYVVYFRTGAGEEYRGAVSMYFDGDQLQRIDDSNPAKMVGDEEGAEPVDLTPDNRP